MSYFRSDFAVEADVTPEVLELFDAWHAVLVKWNRSINLVSPAALGEFWQRHALDSWQVAAHVPDRVLTSIDLGSGAGFPGIAVAILFKLRGRGKALMVESAGKKANFLKALAREIGLPADVTSERAEALPAQPYDLITARAFAPLPRLLGYAQPFWGEGTTGLFLKGENVASEITEASLAWEFSTANHPSRSAEGGTLLAISDLSRKAVLATAPTRLG